MMDVNSQCSAVLQFMKEFGGITSMQAFEYFKITRLSARIHDLRRNGVKIIAETRHTISEYGHDCRYAYYRLDPEGEQA